ncbi:MAG: FG-GAP-like repeat-containing protein [Isosphaeraceae bacterium]
MRFRLASVLVLLVAGVSAWVGVRMLAAREFRKAIDQAKQEIAAGRYNTARKRLIELAGSRDDNGEVDYQLGICEWYRGRPDDAAAAWERVPERGPFGTQAAIQRAMLAMNSGRFTRSEEILQAVLDRCPGPDRPAVLRGLQLLYHLEGRAEDVRRAILKSWEYSDTPAEVVKQLSRLGSAPVPVELTRRTLEKADENDDRVWLARANLAIRSGQLERVPEWLDACARRRPEDPAVWRARLDLARAANDLDAAWRALDHLPAGGIPEAEVSRLRAWLAASLGDVPAERATFSALVEREPGNIAALDRLAEIAGQAGDLEERARLREKKAAMVTAHERYRVLLRGDTIGDPAELAQLAGTLGREIEARGWALVRDRKAGPPGPSRPPLVLDGPVSQTKMLAELCADLRRDISRRPAKRPSSPVPRFVDDAESAGLARFVHDNGQSAFKRLPETMSGGIGLLDFDGDGWLDVYAVQGGPFPPAANAPSGDRLFRNRRDGTFDDVTDKAGLRRFAGSYGHGVAVGDYDNDGHPDLFVTRWRGYALYRNRGDGMFEDATVRAGLGGDRDWPTSAAWADLDGDGDLDLYVCHYLAFDVENSPICGDAKSRVNHYCSPRDFASLPDHVFRNDGGRFVDVTRESGFVDRDGRGLGVVAVDLDDDNRIDIYVANDMSANYLFRNLGGFHFEETAISAGAAANSSGTFQSGMGIACGDLDGDGRPDLAVTNYYGESTTFFHNLGRGLFADHTAAVGIAAPTRQLLGFGIAFLDANNDGRLDLLSANGHVSDYRPAFPWKMPIQLLTAGADGRLTDASPRAGEPFRPLHLGRGLAVGDLDNDGRIDAVVQSQNEPLVYLHNRTDGADHWLVLRLEGVLSNRDGVGARLVVEAGGRRMTAHRFGGGSYQSAGDPRLHFGLGDAARVERLEVRWPSGRVDQYEGLAADRAYLIREGAGEARPLSGFERRPG